MGIQDRDYMRNRFGQPSVWNRIRRYLSDWRGLLATAAAIIGVASAGVWLYRDVRSVSQDFGPAEGSLRANINTATQDELESIPGIGPTRAAQIIAGRPYTSVDDLERLDGIGPNQVESWRMFLTVEGETERR